MARITYGGLITDMSGSVGGSTLQRSQFGPIIRNKPRPLRNPTQNQLTARAIMSQIQYAWRNLSAANRHLWNTFNSYSLQTVRRSQTVAISGYALFIKYNFLRILNGGTIMTSFNYVPFPEFAPEWEWYDDTLPDQYISDYGAQPYDNIFTSIRISPSRQPHLAWSARGLRWMPSFTPLTFGGSTGVWGIVYFGRNYEVGETMHCEITPCSKTSPIIMRPQRLILKLYAL